MDDLNRVLAAFQDSHPSPTRGSVAEWSARYPQFAAELRDAALSLVVNGPAQEEFAEDADTKRYLQYAGNHYRKQAAAQLAYAEPKSGHMMVAESASPFHADLLGMAHHAGLSASDLASRLNLGLPEIAKLSQRLFLASTIPALLIERLASAVKSTVQSISDYLALPPTLVLSADFKARSAPQVPEQASFADSIRMAEHLTLEQREFWLIACTGSDTLERK